MKKTISAIAAIAAIGSTAFGPAHAADGLISFVGKLEAQTCTIDVNGVGEHVVVAHLLQLLERRPDDGRIHQTNTRERRGILLQLAGLDVGDGLVVLDLDGIDPERLARRRRAIS